MHIKNTEWALDRWYIITGNISTCKNQTKVYGIQFFREIFSFRKNQIKRLVKWTYIRLDLGCKIFFGFQRRFVVLLGLQSFNEQNMLHKKRKTICFGKKVKDNFVFTSFFKQIFIELRVQTLNMINITNSLCQ